MDIHEYQAKKILSGFGVTIHEVELSTVQRMQKIKQENLVDLNGLLKHKYIREQEVRLAELFYATLL